MLQEVILDKCSECGSEEIIRDLERGEYVCSQCGLVIVVRMLDQGPEWRAMTPKEKQPRVRTGPQASLSKFDMGLSTVIWVGKDASGRPLAPRMRRRM